MSPLISAKRLGLALHKNPDNIRLIDASYGALPDGSDPYEMFMKERIGNAVFFDIDSISDQTTHLPHMVPTADQFSRQMEEMGVSDDHRIVVYDQTGIAMAACRVWWMLKLFGHDNVVVLNGGLPAWKAEGYKCTTTPVTVPERGHFKAHLHTALYATHADVSHAIENGETTIIDARPTQRFFGNAPEPRPNMNSGHIPTSYNVPAFVLVNPLTHQMLEKDKLRKIFDKLPVSSESPIITSCGSGVTACVDALALYSLGYNNVAVYDGSWSEWGEINSGKPFVKN